MIWFMHTNGQADPRFLEKPIVGPILSTVGGATVMTDQLQHMQPTFVYQQLQLTKE